MSTLPLAGQTALVTGASSGIGRAAALALAAAGADVALNFFSLPDAAAEAAERIRSLGRRAFLYPVDVSDADAVEGMVADLERQTGRVDAYVSSAVYSDREPFLTADLAGFRRTIDVSMWGALYGLRSCCRRMVESGRGGSAVIVGSPHAAVAFPSSMAYNMAKAAVDQMARSAALELIGQRVRVNVVWPGWTDTEGERKFFDEEKIRAAGATLPMGRMARPEEIARAVLWLCDPASEYVTGTTVCVDGGSLLPWWSRRGTGDF